MRAPLKEMMKEMLTVSETEAETPEAGTPANETPAPAERPRTEPLKAVTDFVREHPGVAIAGAITAGLLAGALVSKRTREKLVQHAGDLARSAGAAGLQAWEKAEAAGSDLRERSAAVGERLERLGEAAAGRAETLMDSAEYTAARAGRTIAQKASELKAKVRG